MSGAKAAAASPPPGLLCSATEAAAVLGISTRTFRRLVKSPLGPRQVFLAHSKRPYYRRDEIKALAADPRVAAWGDVHGD